MMKPIYFLSFFYHLKSNDREKLLRRQFASAVNIWRFKLSPFQERAEKCDETIDDNAMRE